MTDPADLDPGAVVVDRDADAAERDEAVVVNTPPVRADEWGVGDQTVAEYPGNEPYEDGAPVACVVYREALDRDPADVDDPLPLADLDAPYYTFPASRLRVVKSRERGEDNEDVDATEAAADAPEELDAIAAAVRERNVDDVTIDTVAEVVRVEKLSLTYSVTRDGTVADSGAYADALEDVAQAALDEADEEEGVVA